MSEGERECERDRNVNIVNENKRKTLGVGVHSHSQTVKMTISVYLESVLAYRVTPVSVTLRPREHNMTAIYSLGNRGVHLHGRSYNSSIIMQ